MRTYPKSRGSISPRIRSGSWWILKLSSVPEKGYIVRDPERSISSKDLYAVYCTWCDENAYPPMKRKTFVEYLSANEEKLGIHYTTHLTNSAGREVRGFRGIGSIISPSGYMQGGWQKVAPDDNPFKDA